MITLDGNELDYFDLICESQSNPMAPDILNKTISISGREGTYFFGTEILSKPFEFTISTMQYDKLILQEKLRTFIAFLHDIYGKPRVIKLIFKYEPDKFYVVRLTSKIDVERFVTVGRMDVKFEAFDPRAYSTVYSDEILWGSEVLNFGSSYLLGQENSSGETTVTDPKSITSYVSGLAIKPIIEITGTATNLVISANGYSINLGTFSNVTWVVDCDRYTVLKNGLNGFSSVNLREFILFPGTNTVAINGSNINLKINVKYRDKYL